MMFSLSKNSAQKTKIKAYLVLLISSLLYAGNVIAGKLIAHEVPPVGLSAIRGLLGLLIILPLSWPRVRVSTRPNKKEMFLLLLVGFFGITLAYITFIIGMKYSSGTNASIIAATLPALTNTLLVIRFKTTLNKLQIFGLVTSFLGLLIVFMQGSLYHLFTLNLGIGDLILLANVSSMALFNVLGQSVMQKLSSVVTSVYALTFGTLLLIPLGVWQLVFTPWHLDLIKLLLIIYMGCFVTGFAFFLNLYGINLIGSGRASIFNNLQPVFSIVLSVIILGESLAIYHLIGFVLVVSGIVLSLTKKGQSEDLRCSESAY